MTNAWQIVREQYFTEEDLAAFFKVAPERIRDLRSNHNTGKTEFMPYSSISAKEHLYHVDDVLAYIALKKSGPFVSQTKLEEDE